MDAVGRATMWRRRKPITTATIAKPLYNPATLTLVILLFNITSAALTLAAALGTTSEATIQHSNITQTITTSATKAHMNATTEVSSTPPITEAELKTVLTTTPASSAATTMSASTMSTTMSMHRGGGVDVRYEVEHKDDLINDPYVQIVFCIIYTTVFVLGIFGNALVCYVVIRNRAMHSVTNYFITNLAISDILLCVLAVPFTPLYTFMGRWIFGATMCHLVSYAQGCSIYLSTFTLTAIAVDRVFVIVFPFKPRMQIRTCCYTLAFIWCFSLVATSPYALYMRVVVAHVKKKYVNTGETFIANSTNSLRDHLNATTTPYGIYLLTDAITTVASVTGIKLNLDVSPDAEYDDDDVTIYCEENWPSESFRRGFGILTTLGQFVAPLGAITVCYIWVSVRLNMRERCRPGAKSAARDAADRERKKRTNFMLIAMVGVFACSWLPMNIVNMVDDFYDKSNDWSFYTFIFFITHALAMSSTCYNPFLYAWLNENFRKEFKHVLPCFNPSKHRQVNRHCYNRSDRNTCEGGRRRNDMGNGVGVSIDIDEGDDDEHENGVTQETSLARVKDKCMSETLELTCSNSGDVLTSNKCCNTVMVHGTHVVDITVNGKGQHDNCNNALDEDCVSGDEHTVEMHFTETAFVSLDNGKDICLLEAGCNKEVGEQIFN
ncbi:PREDICTED: prolactin-releasing peptide receptor [Bactrocera latifrons]|uniref:prolactin-releasing peptide receptor n=1 Tax=Bactrocera latifrons TaxID=174628 RepID=UPI0008DE8243|nr:PREDICTED: prolactin-releasing peptide receptor [Bactrocera latifrons]